MGPNKYPQSPAPGHMGPRCIFILISGGGQGGQSAHRPQISSPLLRTVASRGHYLAEPNTSLKNTSEEERHSGREMGKLQQFFFQENLTIFITIFPPEPGLAWAGARAVESWRVNQGPGAGSGGNPSGVS